MRPFAKSLAGIFFLASLCLAGGGGGNGKLEDIVKSMLGTMDKLATTLGTVRDEDTAKAAHADLKKGAEEWLVLRKRAEDVPPPTKEEAKRLAKEYKSKLEEAQKKLFAEISRVQAVPGGKEVLQELSKVFARKTP